MAAYLGLPYGGAVGTEHLWLADAALCPELPIGWVEHTDEEDPDGRDTPYYQNVWSGETVWEHPQVSYLRGLAGAIRAAAHGAAAARKPPPT